MTALIKSFCGGPGGSFFKKRPLVAEGKEVKNDKFKKLAMAAAKGLAGDKYH
jgi:hypothetical protein